VFDDILCTHYILSYSTHNGDDAPQNRLRRFKNMMISKMFNPKNEEITG